MQLVRIDTRRITDWDTFHQVFKEAFGFPDFYGRNLNAWIDCLGYLDEPEAGMTSIHIRPGEVLTLHLGEVTAFAERCPEQYKAIVECAAFVNARRVEDGSPAVLALSFLKGP